MPTRHPAATNIAAVTVCSHTLISCSGSSPSNPPERTADASSPANITTARPTTERRGSSTGRGGDQLVGGTHHRRQTLPVLAHHLSPALGVLRLQRHHQRHRLGEAPRPPTATGPGRPARCSHNNRHAPMVLPAATLNRTTRRET